MRQEDRKNSTLMINDHIYICYIYHRCGMVGDIISINQYCLFLSFYLEYCTEIWNHTFYQHYMFLYIFNLSISINMYTSYLCVTIQVIVVQLYSSSANRWWQVSTSAVSYLVFNSTTAPANLCCRHNQVIRYWSKIPLHENCQESFLLLYRCN